MSVDVQCVAGWGIVIPQEKYKSLLDKLDLGDFDDFEGAFEDVNVCVEQFGSCYTGPLDVAIHKDAKEDIMSYLPAINLVLDEDYKGEDVKFIREVLWY